MILQTVPIKSADLERVDFSPAAPKLGKGTFQMAEFLGEYVRQWAQDNVHHYPSEDKADEVRRLVDRLYEDAFKQGHDQKDMDDQRVKVQDFIQERFDQVQYGDFGTKDGV